MYVDVRQIRAALGTEKKPKKKGFDDPFTFRENVLKRGRGRKGHF